LAFCFHIKEKLIKNRPQIKSRK